MSSTRLVRVVRTLGILTILYGATFLAPLAVSLWFADGELLILARSGAIILLVGLLLWFPARKHADPLRNTDSFLIVGLCWVGLGPLGALPFVLGHHLGYMDSLFETVSGFTTTGATVMIGIDQLPPSLLLYRQQLQWLGGAGMVVLAIAILPLIGVGGMQLYRAEIPGPEKDAKIVPRVAKTARYLWILYVTLTVSCAAAYWLAGMSGFDAIAHSLTTVSTGGFSTHDASLAYYDSVAIEVVAQVFMLLAALNFAVLLRGWQQRDLLVPFRDPEVRGFLWIVATIIVVSFLVLLATNFMPEPLQAMRYASFHVISVITTTGYVTTDFSLWPLAIPVIYMFTSFVGGCAGSTAGGMKVIRVLLLWKQGLRELRYLVHPNLISAVKLGERVASDRLVSAVWGFFAMYAFTFALLMVLMMMAGENQDTAFSAIATCLNNLGPGLGEISTNFTSISTTGKFIAVWAMLLGRLEIFTLLVLITPDFWQR